MRTICGSVVIVIIHPLRSVTQNPMWRRSMYRVQDLSVPAAKLFVLPERPCQPILEGDTNNCKNPLLIKAFSQIWMTSFDPKCRRPMKECGNVCSVLGLQKWKQTFLSTLRRPMLRPLVTTVMSAQSHVAREMPSELTNTENIASNPNYLLSNTCLFSWRLHVLRWHGSDDVLLLRLWVHGQHKTEDRVPLRLKTLFQHISV